MKKVFVVLMIMALAAGAQANLLVNGDFETGDLTGWTTFGGDGTLGESVVGDSSGFWSPGAPKSGSFSLDKSVEASLVGTHHGVYQTVSGLDSTPLIVSGWVAGGRDLYRGTTWWELRWIDSAWTSPEDGIRLWRREAYMGSGGFDWMEVIAEVNPVGTEGTLVLMYGSWDNGEVRAFAAYFDDFSVEVVPEPGSMMALGTGLAGLAGFVIRRRR